MKIKIKLSELYNIIEEEYQLVNGNGSAWGLPGNWASKVVPVEVDEGRSISYSDVRQEYDAILDFLKKDILQKQGSKYVADALEMLANDVRDGLHNPDPYDKENYAYFDRESGTQPNMSEGAPTTFTTQQQFEPKLTDSDYEAVDAMKAYVQNLVKDTGMTPEEAVNHLMDKLEQFKAQQNMEEAVSPEQQETNEKAYSRCFEMGKKGVDVKTALRSGPVADFAACRAGHEDGANEFRQSLPSADPRPSDLSESAMMDMAVLDYLWKNLKVPGVIGDFFEGGDINAKIDDWFKNNMGNPLVRGLYKSMMLMGSPPDKYRHDKNWEKEQRQTKELEEHIKKYVVKFVDVRRGNHE